MKAFKAVPAEAKVKLVKFGAEWCGPCQAMAKARTMEKLSEKHEDVAFEDVWLAFDEDGDEVEGAPENERAEAYGVEALPTILVVDMEDESLVYAQDSGAMSLAQLEKLLAKAQKAHAAAQKGSKKPKKAPKGDDDGGEA